MSRKRERRLKKLCLKFRVFQDGKKKRLHYLRADGHHVTTFYQFALGFQDADFRKTIAEEFMEEMGKLELVPKIGLILVPALGGIALGATLQHCFYGRKPILAYVEKIEGRLRLRRGFQLPRNRGIALIDDVTSSGGTFRRLIEICEEQNAGPVVFCGAVVNRNPLGFPAEENLLTIPHYALINDHTTAYPHDNCPKCREGYALEKDGTIIWPADHGRLL